MDERITIILHPLLQKYISLIERETPGMITVWNLVGSIALGAFNPRLNYIDFIAVLDNPASHIDVETVLKIHKQIQKQYPQWKLDGMYLQIEDIGCSDDGVRPYLRYLDGRLKWSDRFVPSSVTWWILKKRGVRCPDRCPRACLMRSIWTIWCRSNSKT